MKIKDIIDILEQNEEYKERIKLLKSKKETENIGTVLEDNYNNWLNLEIKW